jgi:hypothetical protein
MNVALAFGWERDFKHLGQTPGHNVFIPHSAFRI